MNLPACLAALPPGYRLLKGERGVLVVRDEYSASLVEAGFGPDGHWDFPASDVSGRRPLGALNVNGEDLLVRQYHHGGMLRFLSGDRFTDTARPFEELLLSSRLQTLGIPTPCIVGARIQRSFGPYWRMGLVSVREPGTQDSARAIRSAVDAHAARPLLAAMGEFVGRLHREGLLHVDLHPGNMLTELGWEVSRAPNLWILDLDRCSLESELSDAQRLGMLARFFRYALRRPALSSKVLSHTNVMRFVRGYCRGAGRVEGDHSWKQEWREVSRGLAARAKRHRLGWRVEEFFGAGAQTRQQ